MDKIELKTMCVIRLLPEQRQVDGRVYFCCGIQFQARRRRFAFWPLPSFPFLIYRTPDMDLFYASLSVATNHCLSTLLRSRVKAQVLNERSFLVFT